MKKTILALALGVLSTTVMASPVILSKQVTSGNVRPEDSFSKDCKFHNGGIVYITVRKGTGSPRTHSHSLTKAQISEIQTLVDRAHSGRVTEVGATCDGGSQILDGFISGHKVVLDENVDCGRHLINQSNAVPRLKSIALQYCGF